MLDQVELLNSPQNNFHSLSGQLIPVLTHLDCQVVNAFFPIYLIRISLATICACSLLPFHCTHASSLWIPPSLHSKQDQFCQLLFMSHVLQQPDHLIKKSDLKRTEWTVNTSLKLLLILLQTKSSVQLRLHLYKNSWTTFYLLPTRTPRTFVTKLFSSL